MMSREEIQELRDALKAARNKPCSCLAESTWLIIDGKLTQRQAEKHLMQCEQGGRMIDSAIDALDCVLGTNNESPNWKILEAFRDGTL